MSADTASLAKKPPSASRTTRYTPPRINIEQLSMYTERTA